MSCVVQAYKVPAMVMMMMMVMMLRCCVPVCDDERCGGKLLPPHRHRHHHHHAPHMHRAVGFPPTPLLISRSPSPAPFKPHSFNPPHAPSTHFPPSSSAPQHPASATATAPKVPARDPPQRPRHRRNGKSSASASQTLSLTRDLCLTLHLTCDLCLTLHLTGLLLEPRGVGCACGGAGACQTLLRALGRPPCKGEPCLRCAVTAATQRNTHRRNRLTLWPGAA